MLPVVTPPSSPPLVCPRKKTARSTTGMRRKLEKREGGAGHWGRKNLGFFLIICLFID